MTLAAPEIIDFHSHYVDPSWELTNTSGLSGPRLAQWQRINSLIVDERALLQEIEAGDLAGRVVNTPATFLAGPDGTVPHDSFRRINDQLAALVARHPGKLHGLASVDAYDGERGAVELVRAVRQLGLRGVFVESAKGDLLIDAPQARPTLAAAAELGVPVFLHPVNPQPLTSQLAPLGRAGTLLARGTINSAALAALVRSGVLRELPGLKVVVTALAIGGILLLSGFGAEEDEDVAALLRRNVFVDTMGFDPAIIRAAVDVLGVDNVLAGSDWPIVNEGPVRQIFAAAIERAGLGQAAAAQIGSLNLLRLIG
ncbi:amidohydrolase family protein [Aminobacter sp. MET-1]|uniref:amidohydrolase family protein n=1 Tax=Aminobacter sp. MET-1 TaxID=2951085 RepID=UPI00226AF700|nr:amidohydrolase family protein [Aminobacter sp. MET-1]MCX8568511.1 amidohydrolase family protein [Aminobacter sp. MET-1]